MEERRTPDEDFLTIIEVARIFRVDPSAVRRWIRGGALEAVTLPHSSKRRIYRVRRSDIERILGENKPQEGI